jgi:hypothetical protein
MMADRLGCALLVLASVIVVALVLCLAGCGPKQPPVVTPTLAHVQIVADPPVPR